jgi:hypothetical protein
VSTVNTPADISSSTNSASSTNSTNSSANSSSTSASSVATRNGSAAAGMHWVVVLAAAVLQLLRLH